MRWNSEYPEASSTCKGYENNNRGCQINVFNTSNTVCDAGAINSECSDPGTMTNDHSGPGTMTNNYSGESALNSECSGPGSALLDEGFWHNFW